MDLACPINLIQNPSIFIFVLTSYFFVTKQESEEKLCMVFLIAAAVSEPEANERGSSLIGKKSPFLAKRKELWLCANETFRMRSRLARSCGYAQMGLVRVRSMNSSVCKLLLFCLLLFFTLLSFLINFIFENFAFPLLQNQIVIHY